MVEYCARRDATARCRTSWLVPKFVLLSSRRPSSRGRNAHCAARRLAMISIKPVAGWMALSLALVLIPPAVSEAQLAWDDHSPLAGPPGRFGHSMAYDAARGVTVLFGGQTADTKQA